MLLDNDARQSTESRTRSKGYGLLDPSVRDPLLAAIPRLRAFAIRLCRKTEEAEDLVQEALLQASANILSFEPGTNMEAWLCTILRNRFFSQYRRQRVALQSIDHLAEAEGTDPEQIARVEYNELCAAIAKLDNKHRAALILVAFSDLSYHAAANLCGCPHGTVKSRVNRARTAVARMLAIDVPSASRPMQSSARPSAAGVAFNCTSEGAVD
jgi:RNA polymerase sigma-70 factor (ECF subfamily)